MVIILSTRQMIASRDRKLEPRNLFATLGASANYVDKESGGVGNSVKSAKNSLERLEPPWLTAIEQLLGNQFVQKGFSAFSEASSTHKFIAIFPNESQEFVPHFLSNKKTDLIKFHKSPLTARRRYELQDIKSSINPTLYANINKRKRNSCESRVNQRRLMNLCETDLPSAGIIRQQETSSSQFLLARSDIKQYARKKVFAFKYFLPLPLCVPLNTSAGWCSDCRRDSTGEKLRH